MSELHKALKNNHPAKIEILLDIGHSPYEKNEYGESFWPKVVRHPLQNKNHIIKKLVSDGVNINAKDKKRNTPLLIAIKQQNTELIHFLLANNVDIDIPGDTYSPLSLCVIKNDMNTIKLLMQKGVNIYAKDAEGKTALFYACEVDNLEIVELLYKQGADCDVLMHSQLYFYVDNDYYFYKKKPQKHYLKAAFHFTTWGNTAWLKICLLNGVSVNAINNQQETLLLIAIMRSDIEKTRFLLNEGADPNIKNKEGVSPLLLAKKCFVNYHAREEIIQLLIDHGAKE